MGTAFVTAGWFAFALHAQQAADPHPHHLELIAAIQRDMREVDRMLLGVEVNREDRERSAAADRELLERVQERHRSNIANLEELIRLRKVAQASGHPGGSGGREAAAPAHRAWARVAAVPWARIRRMAVRITPLPRKQAS